MATATPHARRQLFGAREELERAQANVADALAALARAEGGDGALVEADNLADLVSRAQTRLAEAGRYTTRYALIRAGQAERQVQA